MKKKDIAIKTKLIREIPDRPGNFLFDVEIENKDGQIEKQIIVGKDLQNALSNIVFEKKRTHIIEIVDKIPNLIAYLTYFGLGLSIFWVINQPEFKVLFLFAYMFITSVAVAVFNKGK